MKRCGTELNVTSGYPNTPWAELRLLCQIAARLQKLLKDPAGPGVPPPSSGPGGQRGISVWLTTASQEHTTSERTGNFSATCSNSSKSSCLWVSSPRSFSVVWLNSFWTWQHTHHQKAVNRHFSMCQISTLKLVQVSFLSICFSWNVQVENLCSILLMGKKIS